MRTDRHHGLGLLAQILQPVVLPTPKRRELRRCQLGQNLAGRIKRGRVRFRGGQSNLRDIPLIQRIVPRDLRPRPLHPLRRLRFHGLVTSQLRLEPLPLRQQRVLFGDLRLFDRLVRIRLGDRFLSQSLFRVLLRFGFLQFCFLFTLLRQQLLLPRLFKVHQRDPLLPLRFGFVFLGRFLIRLRDLGVLVRPQLLAVDQVGPGRPAHENRNQQSRCDPPQTLDQVRPLAPLLLGTRQPLNRLGMPRLTRIQQRQPEVVVALAQRAFGITQSRPDQPIPRVAVPAPQVDRFLVREHRPRVLAIVVRLSGRLQLPARPLRQPQAFQMRQILADRRLQRFHVRVTILRPRGHRLQRDLNQFSALVRRRDDVFPRRPQALAHRPPRVRRRPRHNLIQHRPQQIDIAPRANLVQRSRRQFRSHVRRRATHARRLRDHVPLKELLRRDRQAPVHHQHFTEVPEHHVLGLQVAVHHPPRMCKRHRVAALQQNVQVLV